MAFESFIGGIAANRSNEAMASRNRDMQWKMFREQDEINLRNWHMQNEYDSPIQQRKRMEAAGFNPALFYGQGTPGNSKPVGTPSSQSGAMIPMANAFAGMDMLGSMNQVSDLRTKQKQREAIEMDIYRTLMDADYVKSKNQYQRFINGAQGATIGFKLEELKELFPMVSKWDNVNEQGKVNLTMMQIDTLFTMHMQNEDLITQKYDNTIKSVYARWAGAGWVPGAMDKDIYMYVNQMPAWQRQAFFTAVMAETAIGGKVAPLVGGAVGAAQGKWRDYEKNNAKRERQSARENKTKTKKFID